MTLEEVNAIRSKSRAGRSGPWVDYFAEMAKKTALRRLAKMLVLSPQIQSAIERDDEQFEMRNVTKQRASALLDLPEPEQDEDEIDVTPIND
jgi:recombinational DNA repair protein RecT